MFVNCLKQFAICLGVFVIFLLNVMELLCVVGGALLDRPCMVFHLMCVCCAYGPSECLDAPSICFVCVFVCRMLSSHLGVWELRSQVFAIPMLFLCVILHTMSLGESLQLLCIFPFGMLCLSAISMMFVKIMLALCILVGIVV